MTATRPPVTKIAPVYVPSRDTAISRGRKPLRVRLRNDWPLLIMASPMVGLLIVFQHIRRRATLHRRWKDYSPYVGMINSASVGWQNFERVLVTRPSGRQPGTPSPSHQFSSFCTSPSRSSWHCPKLDPVQADQDGDPGHHLDAALLLLGNRCGDLPADLRGAGLLNRFLQSNGFEPMDIMTNPDTFILLLTSQSVWRDAGWGMIVFLAALSTVDISQYEAAAVDGASALRRMWHITLPALKPVIILLAVIPRLGDSLSVGSRIDPAA